MSSLTGSAGSMLLRKPQRTIRTAATAADTRGFMTAAGAAARAFGLAGRSKSCADQYGGMLSYHSPRRRNARQKAALRRCSSREASMSGVTSTSVPGVNSTISPGS